MATTYPGLEMCKSLSLHSYRAEQAEELKTAPSMAFPPKEAVLLVSKIARAFLRKTYVQKIKLMFSLDEEKLH